MDFTFSEEQNLMVDSLGKALEANYDFDTHRKVLEDTATFHSDAMWAALAESGFTGVLAPEDAGGFGGGGAELMAVAAELSRHLSVEPFLSSAVMAVKALELAAGEDQLAARMPGLIDGSETMAVALYEPGHRYDLGAEVTTAEAAGDGYKLSGKKAVVLGADSADRIIVAAKLVGEVALFMVDGDAGGVSRIPYRLVDGRGAADVVLEGAAGELLPGGDAITVLREVEAWANAGSLAETLGAMEQVYDITLEYLKTREQFGRPIGKFQVLQHDMANILDHMEHARSMVIWGCAELENPDRDQALRNVSGARVYVDKAARKIAETSTQMHGGVGVTDEYILSHFVKRLTLGQILFGDRDEHLLRYTEDAA